LGWLAWRHRFLRLHCLLNLQPIHAPGNAVQFGYCKYSREADNPPTRKSSASARPVRAANSVIAFSLLTFFWRAKRK
jgi:hypothetical protein